MSIMVNKESIGCLNSHHSPHQLGAPLSRCYRFGFEYQPQFECSQERKLCHHACIVLSLHSRSSFPFCFGALSIGILLISGLVASLFGQGQHVNGDEVGQSTPGVQLDTETV